MVLLLLALMYRIKDTSFGRSLMAVRDDETAAATMGTAVMISEVDWRMVVSAALLSGALSLLTSVAGLPEAQEK